ncbi:MAG: hypothetical protein M1832_003992 [Thelocarpon impressellum]|nr:MAG: hypothetical protein M1832_003992 [Thelocarpon impressellum]
MASPATATPSPNAAVAATAATSNGAATPPTAGNVKQHFKPGPGSKPALDANRRQSGGGGGGALDGIQRRNSTQRAWTQGTNPITQRSAAYAQSNGAATQPRGASRPMAAPSKESNTPDKHANDRMVFLLANFIGYPVSVTVLNGDVFEGIFSGSSWEPGEAAWTVKMARQTKSATHGQANGASDIASEYVGVGAEHVMSFETKDVADFAVDGVTFHDAPSRAPNGVSSGFRTDADISGNLAKRERNLQRWEPSADANVDMSLESATNKQTSTATGSWDQFEVNERLYGVKTDYDEEIYTTSIDRSNPQYKQRLARAEKIAREIEGGSTMNAHVAEERGQALGDDSGVNEEEKYSGVHRAAPEVPTSRSIHQEKYTPPARRPPTGQPTVAGAPVDPAIISSQIARPGSSSRKPPQQQPLAAIPAQQPKPAEAEKTESKQAPPSAKAAAPAPPPQPAPSKSSSGIKGLPDSSQRKQSLSGASGRPSGSTSPNPKAQGSSATATVENDVRDAFKQFANVEKMRFENRRRNVRQHDKDFKLNDLMKWSKGFKLHTPVPKDLVSILAKDKTKQEEIMEKAQREADEANKEAASTEAKTVAPSNEQKAQRPAPAPATRYDAAPVASQAYPDRQNPGRGRGGNGSQGPYNQQHQRPAQPQNFPMMPARSGPGLSQRLANNQQLNKANAPQQGVPSPGPIFEGRAPPSGPAAISTDHAASSRHSGLPTPASATSTKFNVKAMEFRPNPAASTFTPTGNVSAASSPRSVANVVPASRTTTPSGFFGARKPLPSSARPSIGAAFNPIKRLRDEAKAGKEDWSSNGGIRPAHKTGPRWDVADENKEKTYTEMFDKAPISSQPLSPPHPSHANPHLPHQHQLPFHLQHGGAGMPQTLAPPHQAHQQLHPQHQHHPTGPHHFDDHRMHLSSSASSVMPSPRQGHANMAYQSPMNQHAQLVYGQPVPQYGMGPGGPHMPQFRQYAGGPQFAPQPGGQMGAPMMAHGHSNGPFMGVPQGLGAPFNHQMPMYSPNQVHAYPHHGGAPPPPPSGGYPSPGRGAPMMMHQGSQPGHPQQQMVMYGMSPGQHHQPIYAPQQPGQGPGMRGGYPPVQQGQLGTSPHQPHHYPPQHRGGPNGGHYGQAPHPPPHVGPQQPSGPAHGHGPENGEDGK